MRLLKLSAQAASNEPLMAKRPDMAHKGLESRVTASKPHMPKRTKNKNQKRDIFSQDRVFRKEWAELQQ